jgi:hypothetical protein
VQFRVPAFFQTSPGNSTKVDIEDRHTPGPGDASKWFDIAATIIGQKCLSKSTNEKQIEGTNRALLKQLGLEIGTRKVFLPFGGVRISTCHSNDARHRRQGV